MSSERLRSKHWVFVVIAAMAAYVLYHNERFLFDPAHPVWQHYESFKWWLLPHGIAGACALLLAPLQFSDRLRGRFAKLHRITGRIYVTAALVLAPLGVYIGYLSEPLGSPRSLSIANVVDAALLMSTTGIGFYFALKRNITQHRQWMTRSYAVALIFFEARLILGVTGWDQPVDFELTGIVVWVCAAFSVLIGDLANQMYEIRSVRPRAIRAEAAQPIAAE